MPCQRWSASRRSSSGPAGQISSASGASTGNDSEAFFFGSLIRFSFVWFHFLNWVLYCCWVVIRIGTGTNRKGSILGSVEPGARPQKGIDFFYAVGTVLLRLMWNSVANYYCLPPSMSQKNNLK
jgi:hypothetical protein